MVQYNYQGSPTAPSPLAFPSSNNWIWRDYHSERWYDFDNNELIERAKSKAFDNKYAGCHFNGFRIEGSETDGWSALTVPDPDGAMDFDGDGKTSSFFPTSLDSKSHHQRYSDFIRSHHYRNPFELVTCTGCHDPRGNDDNRNQLIIPADDNAVCTQCHIEAFFPPVDEHVLEQTGFAHDGQALLCVTCHMAGTATSGAQSPELFDDVPPPRQTSRSRISGAISRVTASSNSPEASPPSSRFRRRTPVAAVTWPSCPTRRLHRRGAWVTGSVTDTSVRSVRGGVALTGRGLGAEGDVHPARWDRLHSWTRTACA